MRDSLPTRLLMLLAEASPEKLSAVEQFLAGGALPGSRPGVQGSMVAGQIAPAPSRQGAEVAAVVEGNPRSGRFCICVGPADEAGPRQSSERPFSKTPRYALRREGSLWHLTFNGREAVLRHEQGLCYLAEMLSRPGERVKKLDLAAKYSRSKTNGGSSMEVYDPATGTSLPPNRTESVRESSLAGDEQEAGDACRKRALELKETIDDETETEAAKAEAREELGLIVAHLKKDHRVFRDSTKAAGDAIRNAIKKLLHGLLNGGSSASTEQSVRREFAEHIQRHLLTPSRRYSAPGARKARGELTGCLLYEPPAGVSWVVSQ
jgi:hypothetical protein